MIFVLVGPIKIGDRSRSSSQHVAVLFNQLDRRDSRRIPVIRFTARRMVIFQRINTSVNSANSTDIPLTHSSIALNSSPLVMHNTVVVKNVARHGAIEMTQLQTSATNITRMGNQTSAASI